MLMRHAEFRLHRPNGAALHVNHWQPPDDARGVLLLAHGMSEHGGRYARFAGALAEAGIALLAHDQRGHGRTAEDGMLGHFADRDGWVRVVDDLAALRDEAQRRYPTVPLALLGHSMGSYVAQAFLIRHGGVQAAILSGSNYQPVALYRAASAVAWLEHWRQGATGRSRLIDWLSFGAFNKGFEPVRTRFDFLSRDPAEVDAYLADPLCGFRCTNQFWLDLLEGLANITPVRALARIDPQLPVLVVGGDRDPVSRGRRQLDLAEALRRAGLRHVDVKLYPGARHELLNETNRDEVTTHLIGWLRRALRLEPPTTKESP
jgi:alpha-beta hydrolase superfamily lysophospholipase